MSLIVQQDKKISNTNQINYRAKIIFSHYLQIKI